MRARILNASAGSGKTYQLAYKYVRDVVEQPGIYRHILAVTFTNKATEEMKSRILKEIHLLASGQPSSYLDNLCRELSLDAATVRRRAREVRSKILHDYSRFTVLTIDTFFQRILRAFIKELGIDLNYNVEIETASVLTKSADTLIEQITTDRDLQRWLTDFVQERIDEGKKWDIRDGILTLGGELFKEKNKDALSAAARARNWRVSWAKPRRTPRRPKTDAGRCGRSRADHRGRRRLGRRLSLQRLGLRGLFLRRGGRQLRALRKPRGGGLHQGRGVGKTRQHGTGAAFPAATPAARNVRPLR